MAFNMSHHIPIFEFFRCPSPVLVVVVERAGIALSAESGRALTGLSFVIGQNKAGFCESKVKNTDLAK